MTNLQRAAGVLLAAHKQDEIRDYMFYDLELALEDEDRRNDNGRTDSKPRLRRVHNDT